MLFLNSSVLAPSSGQEPLITSLLLVAMPGAPSSFLFLVVRPGAPSNVLAPILHLNMLNRPRSLHAWQLLCTHLILFH